MSIEAVIYSRLSGFAGLAALVGNRIYPIVVPQDAPLPAVVYRRSDTIPREPLISRDTGTVQPIMEITAIVETGGAGTPYDVLCAIADQIRLALQRWHDIAAGVSDTYILGEIDDYEPESRTFYRTLTVQFDYEEDLP